MMERLSSMYKFIKGKVLVKYTHPLSRRIWHFFNCLFTETLGKAMANSVDSGTNEDQELFFHQQPSSSQASRFFYDLTVELDWFELRYYLLIERFRFVTHV